MGSLAISMVFHTTVGALLGFYIYRCVFTYLIRIGNNQKPLRWVVKDIVLYIISFVLLFFSLCDQLSRFGYLLVATVFLMVIQLAVDYAISPLNNKIVLPVRRG